LEDWVVTAYAITFGGLLVLGGRAADLLGRRRMFTVGLALFSLASLAGGLASDPGLLLASRAVQGIGGAITLPAALSLITTGFPQGPERTRALGLYGATASLGFVAGQVLGGVLVQTITWRSVFLVNVPVGLVAALLAPRVFARTETTGGAGRLRRLDLRGAVLITATVALLVFAVSEGVTLGWTSSLVLGAAALAVVAFVAFVQAESRHPEPLVPPSVFRHAGLSNGSLIALLLGLWNGGEMLVLSLYLQQALHESPLMAGLVIAPQGAVGFLAGMFGPTLSARLGGTRRLLVITGAVAAAGFVVLTQIPAHHYDGVLWAVTLVGFGTAGTSFGSIVIASDGMPDRDQGLVGGMINTARQLGAAIGASLLPTIATVVGGTMTTASVTGDRAAMGAGAVAAVLATVVVLRRRVTASDRRVTVAPARPAGGGAPRRAAASS
ncbi:MAG TPA: MFS transporter, partial [Acidimicrobiales bacterium]|nr:MFS transporter [Acidimicrobiales bacterium]